MWRRPHRSVGLDLLSGKQLFRESEFRKIADACGIEHTVQVINLMLHHPGVKAIDYDGKSGLRAAGARNVIVTEI